MEMSLSSTALHGREDETLLSKNVYVLKSLAQGVRQIFLETYVLGNGQNLP